MDIPQRKLDVGGLKALAHPLRQKILYHLAFEGPATSTSIAERFGGNTGTTSYHLRLLATAGLIEEIAERSTGRERWWRLVPADLRGPDPEAAATPEGRLADARISELWREREQGLIRRYLARRDEFGDWDQAATFSNAATHLTREELKAFAEEYVALLKRYSRTAEDAPADALPIAALFYAFPWPGEQDEVE